MSDITDNPFEKWARIQQKINEKMSDDKMLEILREADNMWEKYIPFLATSPEVGNFKMLNPDGTTKMIEINQTNPSSPPSSPETPSKP